MQIHFFDTMLRAQKGYSQALEPVCRKWELTRTELDVILFLANNPEFDRAADIVTHRGITKSHVSLTVGTLESKGLLLRQEDPRDKRTVHLRMTALCEPIVQAGREAQQSFFGTIFSGVTGEEFAVWRKITEKVCGNI